ncbi:uncharacterized protein LOC106458471 [Limulus polyphemus]|uniref:Uncharacterized protein LOC106458471 n=1 Tax=Limulus polyphemus TaxID=6850 RepID=A0ABM1SAR3_LIMPO|nr:uncharacterized protein LOC106458471 [Limulus polyphemus]
MKRENLEWAGHIEMGAMAIMYRRDFIVFQDVGSPPFKVTNYDFEKKIMLCYTQGNHYDSVYPKSFLVSVAINQSLAYELLYKRVFRMGDEVDTAVQKMLHDKNYSKQRKNNIAHGITRENAMLTNFNSGNGYHLDNEENATEEIRKALAQGLPPFPYKVAKALDPEIYRNVEFDLWNEARKEQLRSEQMIVPDLAPGVKCVVNLDEDQNYAGHIQEMSPDQGPVTVFIEKLGEKRVVPYENLQPLPVPVFKAFGWQGTSKSFRLFGAAFQGTFEVVEKGKRKFSKKGKMKEFPLLFPFMQGGTLPFSMGFSQQQLHRPPTVVAAPALNTIEPLPSAISNVSGKLHQGNSQVPVVSSVNNTNQQATNQSGGTNIPASQGIGSPGQNLFHTSWNMVTQNIQYCPANGDNQYCVREQHQDLSERCTSSASESQSYSYSEGGCPFSYPILTTTCFIPDINVCYMPTNDYTDTEQSLPNSHSEPLQPTSPNPCLLQALNPVSFPTTQPLVNPGGQPVSYVPYQIYPAVGPGIGENIPFPVNLNSAKSQDPSGNDLPLSDLPTVRFFYNLGCDYYRQSAGAPPGGQLPTYPMWTCNGITYCTFGVPFPTAPMTGTENYGYSVEGTNINPVGVNGMYSNIVQPVVSLPSGLAGQSVIVSNQTPSLQAGYFYPFQPLPCTTTTG